MSCWVPSAYFGSGASHERNHPGLGPGVKCDSHRPRRQRDHDKLEQAVHVRLVASVETGLNLSIARDVSKATALEMIRKEDRGGSGISSSTSARIGGSSPLSTS